MAGTSSDVAGRSRNEGAAAILVGFSAFGDAREDNKDSFFDHQPDYRREEHTMQAAPV